MVASFSSKNKRSKVSQLFTTMCIFATRPPPPTNTQVDRLLELSLKVFGDKHWDSDKDVLVHAALGLAKASQRTLGLVEDRDCVRFFVA